MSMIAAMAAKKKRIGTFPKFGHPRPDFKKPPVTEVVLSLQFESLDLFGIPQIGLLWERFRKVYPVTTAKPQLKQPLETFGQRQVEPSVMFKVMDEMETPRCWFENEAGTELIQVQPNFFIFNWKEGKVGQPYPRYEKVRSRFRKHLKTFETFLRENNLGKVVPIQCEVTYVNELHPGQGWKRPGQFGQIFSMWSRRYSDGFLSEPDEARFQSSQPMCSKDGELIGQLRISVEPRYKFQGGAPMLQFVLTARGAPTKKTKKAVFEFFDLGREYVVRGFASVTSKRMHKVWERTDA